MVGMQIQEYKYAKLQCSNRTLIGCNLARCWRPTPTFAICHLLMTSTTTTTTTTACVAVSGDLQWKCNCQRGYIWKSFSAHVNANYSWIAIVLQWFCWLKLRSTCHAHASFIASFDIIRFQCCQRKTQTNKQSLFQENRCVLVQL